MANDTSSYESIVGALADKAVVKAADRDISSLVEVPREENKTRAPNFAVKNSNTKARFRRPTPKVPTSKEVPMSKISKEAPKGRKANDDRLTNEVILLFVHSQHFKEWRGSTMEDVQWIVDAFNNIASQDKSIQDEQYCVRDHLSNNKYIHIRCMKTRCKFNVWLIRSNEENQIAFSRASYISHCPKEH